MIIIRTALVASLALASAIGIVGCKLQLAREASLSAPNSGTPSSPAASSGFVWVGAGSDAEWGTAANWSGGAAPGPSDTAIFDGTCTSNCSPTISTVVSVGGISMTSGYSGTITQAADIAIGSGGFTQAGGTFAGSGSPSDELIIAGDFALGGGTHTATNGVTEIAGNVTISGGVFNDNAGQVRIGNCASNSASTVNTGTAVLGAVHLCKNAANINLASDLIVGGALTSDLGGGSILPATAQYIEARSNVALDDAAAVGNLRLSGANAATFTLCATCEATNIDLSKTGALTVTGTFRVRRNWSRTAGAVTATGSTIHFVGDLQSAFVDDTNVYNHVVMEKASPGDVQVINTVTLGGNLTINNCAADCTVDTGTLQVLGNLTMTQGAGGSAAVTMSGASPQVVSQSGGTMPGGTFTANGANIALGSNLTLNSTGQDLVVAGGELDLEGNNLTVNDRIDHNAGRIYLRGSETVSRGSYNFLTGAWVYYNGTGTYTGLALGNSYASLRFSGTGSYTLNASLSAEWLNVTAGTLNGGGQVISVSSRWENYATFTHGNSTVVLGSTTHTEMLGSTTFYNLTKFVTAARNFHIEPGTTQTVTGTLTLQGTPGQLLSVLSASAGVAASISPTGTRNIAYLNVRDISNVSGTTIYASTTSTNLGNNSDWSFADPPNTLSIEVPIEILSGAGMRSSSGGVENYERTAFTLDTSGYNGAVAYYFEVVAKNTDLSARSVNLVRSDGSGITSLSIPSGTANPTRIRGPAPFTPTTGNNSYRLTVDATSAASDVEVYAARVLVQQVGASRTRVYVPFFSMNGASVVDAPGVEYKNTTNATYELAVGEQIAFRKRAASWAGLAGPNPYTFEAVVLGNNVGHQVSLFTSGGAQVAASEINVTPNWTWTVASASFADDAASFTNNTDFQVRYRSTDGSNFYIQKAGLWVQLDGTNIRGESYYRIFGGRSYENVEAYSPYQRVMMLTTLFTNPLYYLEVSGETMGYPLKLVDDGTGDNTFSGSEVLPFAEVTGASPEIARSRAISLTSGNRYIVKSRADNQIRAGNLIAGFNQPVTDDLVLYLDAARSNTTVSAPYASGTGCSSNLTWHDLAGSSNGTLSSFDTCLTTGWLGSGTPTSPFYLGFGGTDDIVTVPDVNSLSFTTGGGNDTPFSIEIWGGFSDTGSNRSLLTKNNDVGGTASEYVVWLDASEQINVQLTGGAWGSDMLGVRTGTVSPNVFHHILITYDGSKTAAGLKVYVNGVAQSTTDISTGTYAGMINTASSLNLGAWSPGSFHMQGGMAIVRIYAKELSASEVVQNCRVDKARFASVTCP